MVWHKLLSEQGCPAPEIRGVNEAGMYGTRSKQNRYTCISCGHCNIYMIIGRNGIYIVGRCTQSGTHQWESTKKIQFIHELGNRLNAGQCQNKIGGEHLHHVGIAMPCMIICLKGMAFAGRCTQSGTHQWESTKKIQFIHELGNRLNAGQCQNKIGGEHLHHVGIAMPCMIKLYTTSGGGYMEVTVKTKQEVHIYVMLVVPLKRDGRTDGRKDGRPGNIMSRRSYRAGHKNAWLWCE